MNGELVPAIVAAGGGTGLLAGILYHERRQAEAMRASRQRFKLVFPIGLDAASAEAVLGTLAGLSSSSELILEVAASEDGVTHAVMVPGRDVTAVRAALGGATKVLELRESDPISGRAMMALRLFVPRVTALRSNETEAASRALLAGLAALGPDERVVIRWALAPGVAPRLDEPKEPTRESRAAERAWHQKAGGPGFSARGLVLVQAGSVGRARVLLEMVGGMYRGRRGALGGLRPTQDRRGATLTAAPRIGRFDGWLSAGEVLGLVAWPIGEVVPAGVELGASRELRVRGEVPREGRRLLISRDGRGERPVALSPEAARHGLVVIGPSGSGKSEVLARAALSDIASGFGGAVVDPKGGDLVQSIIDRVSPEDAERIVVLDPARGGPPIGLNVLGVGDRDLAADLLAGVIRRSSPDWTVRTEQYLRLGLRTLAESPGSSLADIPRLFFDWAYRRQAVARLSDDVLASQWRAYEALSPASQAEHLQAPMTRVMTILSRPSLRGVLASPAPRLDVGKLLEGRGWLLASVSPGTLGEAGARIVTAAVLFLIWSAMEARAALPPERRRPVFVTIDELASVATAGFDIELMIERLRGLGGGVSLGVQTLGRLPEVTRSAILGNVASLVSFRAGADESVRIAKELPGLAPTDIQALGRFRVAARLGTGLGSAVTVMTGRTEPLPERTGQATRIRALSAKRYGSELEPDTPKPDVAPDADADVDTLGRARRDG